MPKSGAGSSRTNTHKVRGLRSRQVNQRDPRQRFLIVCQGTKTEPLYFNRCLNDNRIAGRALGIHADPPALVRKAIEMRKSHEYDAVWCVFDRDETTALNFNQAVAFSVRNHINVAYSIEAFELWFVLHFQYLNAGVTRADYARQLTANLGVPYSKSDPAMYDRLIDRQGDAIRNAVRLLQCYPPHSTLSPAENNPSTTVHLLVQELMRYAALR